MESQTIENKTTITVVTGEARTQFLPQLFKRHFIYGEQTIFNLADRLSPDYDGGFWEYLKASNGAMYVRPKPDRKWKIQSDITCGSGELSSDGFGLMVTKWALCAVLERDNSNEDMFNMLDHISNLIYEHDDCSTILSILD